MDRLTPTDFLHTNFHMELHEINSIEDHSIDCREWVPKSLRNERPWSHERMMRELRKPIKQNPIIYMK